MRTADLSPSGPEQVRQSGPRADRVGQRRAELYPGRETDTRRERAAPRQSVQRTSEGYQLNFDDAPLADVAKVILGDTLNLPYMIDPRVQGRLTVSTGRALTRDELLKAFEAAMRFSNGALMTSGGSYQIIPTGEASPGFAERVSGETNVRAGFGISIMPLRNTSAESMLRLIDGFVARAGSVKAETAGNLLLIRGGGQERETIIDIIATFDVDWLRGQSAGIFPLTHAAPDELITELNQVLQTEGGTLTSNLVRLQPIARLNAVLVLTQQSRHLQTVGEWIRRLDRTNPAGQTVYVYQVENGKAVDIAQLLSDMFGAQTSGGGRRSARAEVAPNRDVSSLTSQGFNAQGGVGSQGIGGTQPGGSPTQPQLGGNPSNPAQPRAATGAPGTAAVPRAATGSIVSAGSGAAAAAQTDIRIVPDETNNKLLIRATQAEYQKILVALRQIDRPPLQVLINATIAEVTLNDKLRYGVQAFLDLKGHGRAGYTGGPTLALRPSLPGLNLLVGSDLADPKLVLDALSDVTTVKVVSSPSLVVVDNQSATLKVGDEVPVTTQQVTNITENAPIVNQIRFRETGVILKVTPRVNSSGLVTMDVEQEISQVVSTPDGATTLTPTISQRRIQSTVAVYSGQTVALGGLISEQTGRDRKSVPIVNQIPLIGEMIGRTELGGKRTELIVFIKPQVIRNSRDASDVSEELRAKLKSMAFPPPPNPHDARRQPTLKP